MGQKIAPRIFVIGFLCAVGIMPRSATAQDHTAHEHAPPHHAHEQAKPIPWTFTLEGNASIVGTVQSGPRGRNGIFGVNHIILGAERTWGPGTFNAEGMFTLEPFTVARRAYPLLFQTGETAYGKPLVDGQHPHDAVMTLAARYTIPVNSKTSVFFYGGPVGEPALGPPAFMHRASASEMPAAPLSHHLQDSTHITFNVVTAGFVRPRWSLEASGFRGREPDERRWGLEGGKPDSWSARFTFRPTERWSLQASGGRLKNPETHETSNVVRFTASASYDRLLKTGSLATTFAWGRNYHAVSNTAAHAYLAESTLRFKNRNYLYGRFEHLDRENLEKVLLHHEPATAHRITAVTAGYARDITVRSSHRIAAGMDASFYHIPPTLMLRYGQNPRGMRIFMRYRFGGAAPHHAH